MFALKEKTYEHSSEKIVDYLIGILLLVLSVLPLIFTQIGDAIFSFLTGVAIRSGISDGRDALGFAIIVMMIVFGLPVVVGILTYLISRKRKLIFRGFVLAIPILLIIWLTISGAQKDQEISKLHYQIDDLKKQQKTQTNDSAVDTSGWKTYTDKNGYQISYPNDFYFQDVRQIFAESRDEASKAGGAGGAPLPDDRIMFSTDSSDFATKARKNTGYVFYIDTYSGLGTGDFLGIPTDNSFSTRNIGGISWKTKTYADGTLAMNVNKKNILYFISIPGETARDAAQMKKVDAMLNSFKFTADDETVNWNLYTNKTYGYSISYPKDWSTGCNERGDDRNLCIYKSDRANIKESVEIYVDPNVKSGWLEGLTNNPPLVTGVTPVNLAGISTIRNEYNGTAEQSALQYNFEHNGIRYLISIKFPQQFGPVNNIKRDFSTDPIINTFKFTK